MFIVGCLAMAWLAGSFDCAIVLSFLAMPGLFWLLCVTLSQCFMYMSAARALDADGAADVSLVYFHTRDEIRHQWHTYINLYCCAPG